MFANAAYIYELLDVKIYDKNPYKSIVFYLSLFCISFRILKYIVKFIILKI